ncbi:MAG TPA: hypothetical protein DCP02_00950 [Actinobacteria bacterium]|nr:hypothetical protein [Actinomycetota bacterium]
MSFLDGPLLVSSFIKYLYHLFINFVYNSINLFLLILCQINLFYSLLIVSGYTSFKTIQDLKIAA